MMMRGIGHLGGLVLLAIGGTHANVPSTMRQVREKLACGPPQFACVSVETVKTPSPKEGEALIRVNASSVNPSDVDNVEGGGCMLGCGADVAGTVVACPKCTTLSAGDEVWTAASHAYSDYVIAGENRVAAKPKSLSLLEAGTIPEVGLTSLFSLKRTAIPVNQPIVPGSPWTNKGYTNLTVVITAGAGGTGFIGIELARAFGAVNIFTAASGADEIAFVKSLGATLVVDYKVQNLFSALPDDSVDIVYDNYGEEGTADKAMHAIRSGGMYLLLPNGECFESRSQKPPCLSGSPKAGVSQLNYATSPDYATYGQQGLQELAQLFDAKQLAPHIAQTFPLFDIAQAFNLSAGGGAGGVGNHQGKISIQM